MNATVKAVVPVLVATVTDKASGSKFYVYRIPSTSNPAETYQIGVHRGLAVHCTCPSRKHSHKACKHMKAWNEAHAAEHQAVKSPIINRVPAPRQIPAEQTFTAPLAERGTLNGNRGFSLMRR